MITPLQTFRDIHKDKMAFLLGTGVSLDSVDVEKLRPYITMGVNGSLFKISDPDYFFTADGGVFRYGLLTIISKNTHIILSNELDFSDEGIDVDLYVPTKLCLELLYNKVIDGGYVLVHDMLPGCEQAINEFITKHPEIKLNYCRDRGGYWWKK